MLFILAISSLGVYGIVLAGWASNSKYPFLGAIRASAQMISYELAMGLALFACLHLVGCSRFRAWDELVRCGAVSTGSLARYLAATFRTHLFGRPFAETNRLLFDMAESETDLVGGFHTEYGAFKFGLFFVAEYAHIIMGSALFVVLFLGGWNFLPFPPDPWGEGWLGAPPLGWRLYGKGFMVFFFIWMRWTLPRFRYDQVMSLGWSILLPLAIANLVFNTLLIALIDTL